jgi:hypothetical protein
VATPNSTPAVGLSEDENTERARKIKGDLYAKQQSNTGLTSNLSITAENKISSKQQKNADRAG